MKDSKGEREKERKKRKKEKKRKERGGAVEEWEKGGREREEQNKIPRTL